MNFDIEKFFDYIPLKLALSNADFILVSEEDINNEQLKCYINIAEKAQKIIIFNQINFSEINFIDIKISVPILFHACNFNQDLEFNNCNFLYQIFFHSAHFIGFTKFKTSSFENGVSFVNSIFYKATSFERVKFSATNIKYIKKELSNFEIYFPNLFYRRNTIDFLGTEFFEDASFISVHFGSSILFAPYKKKDSIFHQEVDFSCVIEEKETLVLESNVSSYTKNIEINLDSFHRIFFQNVKFYGEANFENRSFQKKTSFKNSSFYRAPKFHNCIIHQDTDFRGTNFVDIYSERAEHAYRTLKLIMNKKRARREEVMFFALEQKSLLNSPIKSYGNKYVDSVRFYLNNFIINSISEKVKNQKLNKNFIYSTGFYVSLTEKIISFIYLILADYGQSIKRPILILSLNLCMLFPLLYRALAGNSAVISLKLKDAYYLSFQQLFRPFEIFSIKYASQYGKLPFILYFLTSLESLLNMGLFALFILAIRGRFKMY